MKIIFLSFEPARVGCSQEMNFFVDYGKETLRLRFVATPFCRSAQFSQKKVRRFYFKKEFRQTQKNSYEVFQKFLQESVEGKN